MTTTPSRTLRKSAFARCLPWATAALTFGASALAHATGIYEGEGAVAHGAAPDTSLRQPAWRHASTPATSVETASTAPAATSSLQADEQRPTRSEVRRSAQHWKQAQIATPSNEIGDTPEVLKARDDFYALQAEVRHTQYVAAAEAELARQEAAYAAAQQALSVDDEEVAAAPQSLFDDAVAQQELPQQQPGAEREIYVRPEMTLAELMSYLDDDRSETADVTVLMVSADEDID